MAILNRNWITCCAREDQAGQPQPPYLHSCGCPSLSYVAASVKRLSRLEGFSEYIDPSAGIVASVPPRMYLTQNISVSRNSSSEICLCGSAYLAYSHSYEYDIAERYDAATGDYLGVQNPPMVPGAMSTNYYSELVDVTPEPTEEEPDPDPVVECRVVKPGPTYEPETPAIALGIIDVDSQTSGHFDWDDIATWTDGCTRTIVNQLFVTNSLSDEDTEANAIARATPVNGSATSAVWELRSTGIAFTYQSCTYGLIARNLIPGANYVARYYLRRRPAIKGINGYVDQNGDPSEWEYADGNQSLVDEYEFTATAHQMVVPGTGTWNGDADADHSIDAGEVTPLVELPLVQGWEYALYRFVIELAL